MRAHNSGVDTAHSSQAIGPRSNVIAHRGAHQRGVVLFTSLVLLVILTLVGVMLSRMQTVEERISQNDQDHQLAVQAAEATLRFAEVGLYNGTYTNFVNNTAGLYTWQSGTADAYVTFTPFNPANNPAVQLLAYNGPALPVSGVPAFLIENLPSTAMPGTTLSLQQYNAPTPPVKVFRITAYSYGGDTNATATLQEIDWQQ
jgi:Tfp pilus assembly protein PilX